VNVASQNANGEYYIASIYVTTTGEYGVESVYLLRDGTKRADGGRWVYKNKAEAIKRVGRLMHTKKRMKGFHRIDLGNLPDRAKKFLRPNVDTYLPPDEMLRMVEEAIDERYVEFDCVTGLEERFDEGLEYLAQVDREDPDYLLVWDRNGIQCKCHKSRFSRIDKTERTLKVDAVLMAGER